MKFKLILLSVMASVAGMSAFGGRANYAQPNYDKSKIAPYTLEDPLTFADGTKVKTPVDWERRRQEILAIFAKNTFGQHLLIAAIAPRKFFCQGYDEPWFDTEGEYLAIKAASPVWTFLGKQGLPDQPYPADFDTSCIGEDVAYVRRPEGHGYAAHDWMWLMDFCDSLRK